MAGQDATIKTMRGIATHCGSFIVDGFNFVDPRCRHYFLTHFHSDHTAGLHAGFDVGTIYCSAVTAELVIAVIGVRRKNVVSAEAGHGEQQIGGSGGSLEPPGPLLEPLPQSRCCPDQI